MTAKVFVETTDGNIVETLISVCSNCGMDIGEDDECPECGYIEPPPF